MTGQIAGRCRRRWAAASRTLLLFLLATDTLRPAGALKARDIVFVVLSQDVSYYANKAHHLKDDIQQQAQSLAEDAPVVHLSHQDFPHTGAWTVIPILPRLSGLHGTNSSWIFFSQSHTKISLSQILHLLNGYNAEKEMWVGHGLFDREATIIHHFAFSEDPRHFKYPNFASGFGLSVPLLNRLSSRVRDYAGSTDFSIDPAHELALFIWNNGLGPRMKHNPQLCLIKNDNCASYPDVFEPCGDPVSKKSIYFAVKTCKRFHEERIPVVKKTWAKSVANIGFYSEVTDTSIPTINLGVPNTERGHCGKTFAILKHVASLVEKNPDLKWVFIADDDTILSVARLQQLLSCFNPKDPIAIGERYGYSVLHPDQGYNFITGGGGMVLSKSVVQMIDKSPHCKCPSLSTPDDMFLGMCLATLGVPITHSPLFHQARPKDYAPEYLTNQVPVSFHNHWMIDPVSVYNKWFAKADKQFEDLVQPNHVEL